MRPSTASPSMRRTECPSAAAARSDSPWGLPDRVGCAPGPGHVPPVPGPDEDGTARPGLVWAVALVLAGLCIAAVQGIAPPVTAADPAPAGFNLQADLSSSKLNTTSAGAPGPSEPALPSEPSKPPLPPSPPVVGEPVVAPQPAPERPEEPAVKPAEVIVPVQAAEPPLPKVEPKEEAQPVPPPVVVPVQEVEVPVVKPVDVRAVEAAPVPPPQPLAPLDADVVPPTAAAELTPNPSCILRDMQQGDSPMTRSWKMFGLQSALLAALAVTPAAPAPAAEDNKLDGKEITKRLDQIDKAIEEILKGGASFNDALRTERLRSEALAGKVKKIEDQLDDLKKGLDEIKKAVQGRGREGPDPLEDIARRLAEIERILKADGGARVSRFPADAGNILLTNRYPEEILFVINGKDTYRLAPGTSRMLDAFPAGTFSYEVISSVWGVRARKTTSLAAGETFRLTVE